MLSNFEKGFEMFVRAMDEKDGKGKTRHINESICLMASEDSKFMKDIVVNEWMINRALSSPFSRLIKADNN